MAPRSGQLDQISEAIGELKGSVKSIEKYVHTYRHEGNNLSQKIDALGTRITRDIAAVEARIEIRIAAMDGRIGALEKTSVRDETQKSVIIWLLQSPLLAWMAAAAVMLAAWWKGGR